MITAGIYARVSDDKQHTENQVPELRAYAEQKGWPIVEYLEDASGKQGSARPVLAQMLADAKSKKINVVIVWKMDRFGRSVKDFLANIEALNDAGCRFITTTQPIDTDERSPFGKMIMVLMMLFAEFERDLIIDRVKLGVQRYQRDFRLGRIGKDKIRESKSKKNLAQGAPLKCYDRYRIPELLAGGMSRRAIAAALGISEGLVRLELKKVKAA